MTQRELDGLMAEMAQTLRDLGIPVSRRIAPEVLVNSRAKRRLGCCYIREGGYAVEVSARLLDDEDALRQTLAHELLHTCPGCRNHGEAWKRYAAVANEALGYQIQRLAPAGEEDQAPSRREAARYLLVCQSCGREIPRARRSKAVRQPWRYRCPCGGKLKREEI